MLDILLPFKHSKWGDIELKYCLRSLEKHLKNYGDLYIIGDKPLTVKQNFIHVPFESGTNRVYKERNIFQMGMWAVDNEVGDPFIFFNDDHFLLRDYEAKDFPNYYAEWPVKSDMYGHTIANTKEVAEGARFADVHCPMVFDKQRFRQKIAMQDWDRKGGYCMKTLYADGLEGEQCTDLKIRLQYPAWQLQEMIKDRDWFSIDDASRGPEVEGLLKGLYPNKSKYE